MLSGAHSTPMALETGSEQEVAELVEVGSNEEQPKSTPSRSKARLIVAFAGLVVAGLVVAAYASNHPAKMSFMNTAATQVKNEYDDYITSTKKIPVFVYQHKNYLEWLQDLELPLGCNDKVVMLSVEDLGERKCPDGIHARESGDDWAGKDVFTPQYYREFFTDNIHFKSFYGGYSIAFEFKDQTHTLAEWATVIDFPNHRGDYGYFHSLKDTWVLDTTRLNLDRIFVFDDYAVDGEKYPSLDTLKSQCYYEPCPDGAKPAE